MNSMMGQSPGFYIHEPSLAEIGPPALDQEKKIFFLLLLLLLFTIYGCGDNLDHVTRIIYTKLQFSLPQEAPHKI